MSDRLNHSQIIVVRGLFTRSGGRPVTLDQEWQRGVAAPLAHNGIVEIWYRQAPGTSPALHGPYFSLSIGGARLAAHFVNPAPRGFSGAEQVK